MHPWWRRCSPAVIALYILLAAGLAAGQSKFDQLSREALSQVDSNPGAAVKLYKQGLAKHPGWAEGWLYMGSCLFKLGRFREARDALRKGVQLEPNEGTPLAFLGMAEYELGDFRRALADMLKGEAMGLADDPAFVAAVRYRAAVIGLKNSNFVEAMQQLKPLVRSGNNAKDVIEAFGMTVLKIAGEPGKLPNSQQALVAAAGQAAWAYESQRIEEAHKLLQQLVMRFPYAPGVHYLYGVSLIRSDPTAAAKEFRQEISISPQDADAHAQLALLLIGDKKLAAAVKQARTAARLRPNDPWCNATLGRALLEAGDTKAAIAALQESAKLAPHGSLSHFYLARAYKRLGNLPAAEKEQAEWRKLHAKEEPGVITRP